MAKKTKHYIDMPTHQKALDEARMERSESLHMMWVTALNVSLGIGEERLMKKVLPALVAVGEQYLEWAKAGGLYYAKRKLLEATNEVLKTAPFDLWIDKFVLDDGTEL